ncbi:MAG TPA: ferritin-like protein [Ramlibacter sp.]|jgi:hypothetical protein|nr:ferritin-like protein [Ramlibacter sp.]
MGFEHESDSAAANGGSATREQVLHMLAEAAELEHNILCSYLYATFSMKRREDEGVTRDELEAIGRWRGAMMGLCVEEMVHLAQVCNLMVAMGARPHFNRPNLPVAPGCHPAGVAITLAPFGLETLEHFIFLERPEEIPVADPAAFQAEDGAERPRPAFRPLMPRAPSYETIGGFYEALRREVELAASELGEGALFSGPADLQLTADEIRSPDLVVVRGVEDARRAIDFILEQGEGSGGQRDDSHFGRFEAIRDELLALRSARPEFEPARAAARDPVMHAPVADDRVWIQGAKAGPVIDAANAAYCAMLRCLSQLYDTPSRDSARREALLSAALGCMKAVTSLGSCLTELPANDGADAPRAGMSFAMLRATEGLLPEAALPAVAGQLALIAVRLPSLATGPGALADAAAALTEGAEALRRAR